MNNVDLQFNDILARLKFISTIKVGDKVCVKNKTLVYKSSWLGAIFRYWTDENRIGTLNELQNLCDECRLLSRSLNIHNLDILHKTITIGMSGIFNLIQTYNDDNYTIYQLRNIYNEYKKLLKLIEIHKECSSPSSSSPSIKMISKEISEDRSCYSAPSCLQHNLQHILPFKNITSNNEVPVFPSMISSDHMYQNINLSETSSPIMSSSDTIYLSIADLNNLEN